MQGEQPENQPSERFIKVSLREERMEVNHNVATGRVTLPVFGAIW